MRRVMVLVGLVAAVVVALYATGAWSAAALTPTEKSLLKDVKTLKSQMKKLQADTKKLKTQANETEAVAIAAVLLGICQTAIVADSIQGSWQVIDQLSAATQAGKTYFGAQVPVDDTIGGQAVCRTLGLTRSQAVPPTIATFNALLALFKETAVR